MQSMDGMERMTDRLYPATPERPVTRAEIERLTSIIRQLNDALDAAVNREDRLRHERDVQRARAEVAEAPVVRGRRTYSDEPLVVNVAINERLKDD